MRLLKYLFLIVTLIFSCKKDIDQGNDNANLIGNWNNPVYNDLTISFEKTNELNNNAYYITFKTNGKLVEHKNSGWCGTPPISYSDFEGTWNINDSIITINVGYWGGNAEYQWKIIWFNNSKLQVRVLNQTYNLIYQ